MAFKIKDSFVIGAKTIANADGRLEQLEVVGTTTERGALFYYGDTVSERQRDRIRLLPGSGSGSFNLSLTPAGLSANRQATFPDVDGTVVYEAATQTLSAKTLTAPVINGATTFSLRDTAASFNLALASTSAGVLTGTRTLTFDVTNADRTIDLAGNLTLAANFTTSGAFATTLTSTNTTNVTLPTTGTLATLLGTETFQAKTINLSNNTITGTISEFNIALSDANFATLLGTEQLENKTLITPTIAIVNGSTASSGTLTLRSTTNGTKNAAGIRMDDGITSSSSITGTLVVTGGVGISENLNVGGNAIITGNLTVEGTTTTINTATLDVEDKNILLGNVTTPSDSTADGGGITLKGANDYTITWVDATNVWETNCGLRVGTLGTLTTTFTADGNAVFNANVQFGNATTDTISVNSSMANGTSWKTTQTSGHTFSLQAYDNDAPGYVNLLTLTAGDTPTLTIGGVAGTEVNATLNNLTLGGNLVLTSATNATAKNNGALQVDGGISVDKDLFITGSAVYASDVSPSNTTAGSAVSDVKGFQKDIGVNTEFVLDEWDRTVYRSAKYLIQMKQGSEFQVSEVIVLHDGTNSYFTEYGVVENVAGGVVEADTPYTNESSFATDFNGSNLRLKVTINDAATTAVKVNILRTLMRVYD